MTTQFSPALATRFERVYVVGTGLFLPGAPIGNDSIDDFIAPLDGRSNRIRNRVLRENGIEQRHYAIDRNGNTTFSSVDLAVAALQDAFSNARLSESQPTLLSTGSSGGDTGMPGFANMVQGALGVPPLEASSHQGVCAAGVQALKYAASSIELGAHRIAATVAAEFPSRLFKGSRFEPHERKADFDAHFLRWMLSDGAGACVLADQPHENQPSLRLDWIHCRAFSGDYPVCMQIGLPGADAKSASLDRPASYLDYPSLAEAEKDGAFVLRQDIRLLPNLFEVGIHEYASLATQGWFNPDDVDHFLCHYSSEKFSGVVERLMHDSGLTIPKDRWYSNLTTRGNTGAASIFIMLADFLRERQPQPGERILCFVPESGRFTIACMMFEVVGPSPSSNQAANQEAHQHSVATMSATSPAAAANATENLDVLPPHAPTGNAVTPKNVALRELADVWHDYRSRAWRTPLVRKILAGTLQRDEYLGWMACWIPQVREGSGWMRRAAANTGAPYEALIPLVEAAASDEQLDYTILFEDYRRAGGDTHDIDVLTRNAGGDALHAYMSALASQANPVGLLGAMYVIEGTGQRIIPHLLPKLRRCPSVPRDAFRFLHYHGENDLVHLERWLDALTLATDAGGVAASKAIVQTAADTAELYLMQLRGSVPT